MGYRCLNCGLTSDNTAPCPEPACGFRVGRFEPYYDADSGPENPPNWIGILVVLLLIGAGIVFLIDIIKRLGS